MYKKELHVISTGQQLTKNLVSSIKQIHPYLSYFHLREKDWTKEQIENTIKNLYQAGVPLNKIIVNTHIDIAQNMKIAGAQLTQENRNVYKIRKMYPSLRIGCSVHSIEEAIKAQMNGVDFIMYGHIFESTSKPNIMPKGLKNLQEVTNNINIPIIAIGGITLDRVNDVVDAGADGAAVLSGILLADDPLAAVQNYKESLYHKNV